MGSNEAAVAPQTSLNNMDISSTTPSENQEVPLSIGSNEDALLRLLFLNPNMGEYVRLLSNLFVWILFIYGF